MEREMRKFKMYCKKGINMYGEVDEEMIGLFFEVDGEIVDSSESDCIDNILISSYEMYHVNCEKYGFDGRNDELEINIDFKF